MKKYCLKDENNYYMVINLLGNSLQTIKEKLFSFSLNLVLELGIKIVTLLKTIHEIDREHFQKTKAALI
jgi:hypothetical protein